MIDYWSNFAKNGNPNGPTVPNWPKYDDTDQVNLLNTNAQVQSGLFSEYCRFWDKIGYFRGL